MAKFKPTAGQKEVIEVLAHISVMQGIDKNVKGMEGIFQHYLANTLNDRQHGIFLAFDERVKRAHKDMAAMAKKDKEKP